jgi:AAA domain
MYCIAQQSNGFESVEVMRRKNKGSERQARIVRYWRAVEYFSPPKVDAVDPEKGVRAVGHRRKLPWEPGELTSLSNSQVWRHTVYAGIFDISKVREVLQNVLRAPDSEHDLDGRVGGKSALLSFAVDDTGHLLKDSITLSSCAWAVSRTLMPGPESDAWLDGFEEDQRRLLAYLFEIGDGRIRIDTNSAGGPRSGRGLGLIAGTAARVALDVATGGIASLPSVISLAAAPTVGPIAAKVIEKLGDSLAQDATNTIDTVVKAKKDDDKTRASDSEGDRSGRDEDSEASASPPYALGTKVLTVDDLAAITRWVAETLGVAGALKPDAIRVKSYQVSLSSADDVSTDEFLNSFYADDLERVANAVEAGDAGTALTAYLRPDESIDMTRRIDLRQSPRTVLQSLAPTSMPLGRWPAKPDRPLTLSQQFAINKIFHSFKEPGARGMYAVNGPPGTGKTTMLRDLIAALVVERATHLAKLKSARDAFEKKSLEWRTEASAKGYPRSITPLKPALTGFEIVIASSNNGAVENITLEVPAARTVDLESFPDADYLSDPATILTDIPCWGAVAARLGRRSYRQEFVKRFWWGNGEQGKRSATESSERRGLQQILKDLRSGSDNGHPEEVLPWSEAVRNFTTAVEDVQRLARNRQRIAEILEEAAEPDATLAALRKQANDHREYVARLQAHRQALKRETDEAHVAFSRAEVAVIQARDLLASAREKVDRADTRVKAVGTTLHIQAANKPGLLRRLWSRNALTTWQDESRPLAEALHNADRILAEAEARYTTCEADLSARQHKLNDAAQTEQHRRTRLSQCEKDLKRALNTVGTADRAVWSRETAIRRKAEQLDQARRWWPDTLPGNEWNAAADDRDAMERRERSSPWMDQEFAAARSRAFLAALDVHRAVLTAEPNLMWHNLRAAIDVVNGDAPSELPQPTIVAAWQMVFFVVPVVSTTFASMSRMFAGLGRETLGWLFIDEAGQAAPQMAVGALWRSQRAVVVGDPRQLEPVITLPWSGQKRLCRQFGVDPQWAPQSASVQSVADRLNTFGTWLSEPDSSAYTWVGSPLRLHRRCDQLMFEVSNKIAYDNMMVYGVTPREPFELLAKSTWLDVRAHPTGSKWNPIEGGYVVATLDTIRKRIAQEMNNELANTSTDLPEWAVSDKGRKIELARRVANAVFVMSPFRDIVDELRKSVRQRLPPGANRLGTIHTTQGKEADIVILVLGTATDQVGSRQWASQTPNLLNVAVTRARRRLVVIGDYRNWSQHSSFHVLAEHARRGVDSLLTVVDVRTEWPLANQYDSRQPK